MRWVVNPAILLRRRFEGTTAWRMDFYLQAGGKQKTLWAYNFIDDAFVRVEIEGQTGIAIQVIISQWWRRRGEGRTISQSEPERPSLSSLCERDPGGLSSGERARMDGWIRQDLLTIVVRVVDVGSRRARIQ